MKPSHFHLGLVATLSLSLGLALSSSRAVGYPAASAISYGANPVWSAGGALFGDGSTTLLTAPSDQALVVTDVSLSLTSANYACSTAVAVGLGDGSSGSLDDANLGRFGLGVNREGYNYTKYHPIQVVQLNSGAKIEPGDSLQLYSDVQWRITCSEGEVALNYMISGYYAQP